MRRKPCLQLHQRSARRYYPSQLAYKVCPTVLRNILQQVCVVESISSVSIQEEAVEEEDDDEEDEEPAKVSTDAQCPTAPAHSLLQQLKDLALQPLG